MGQMPLASSLLGYWNRLVVNDEPGSRLNPCERPMTDGSYLIEASSNAGASSGAEWLLNEDEWL